MLDAWGGSSLFPGQGVGWGAWVPQRLVPAPLTRGPDRSGAGPRALQTKAPTGLRTQPVRTPSRPPPPRRPLTLARSARGSSARWTPSCARRPGAGTPGHQRPGQLCPAPPTPHPASGRAQPTSSVGAGTPAPGSASASRGDQRQRRARPDPALRPAGGAPPALLPPPPPPSPPPGLAASAEVGTRRRLRSRQTPTPQGGVSGGATPRDPRLTRPTTSHILPVPSGCPGPVPRLRSAATPGPLGGGLGCGGVVGRGWEEVGRLVSGIGLSGGRTHNFKD